MDSNLNKLSLDVPPNVASSSKASVASSSLVTGNIGSAEAQGTSQSVVHGVDLPRKHIIRKIIPLDPKKLQQAGLDRKIAEALSKQKTQQSNSATNQNVHALPPKSPQTQTVAAKNLTFSKRIQISPPAQDIDSKRVIINKLKPPKITVTGPEALTEQEKLNLANLNPQQRLVHVKNLLNKKILQKKSKEINDNTKTNLLLQTPQAIGDKTQHKLSYKVKKDKYAVKGTYDVLKEPKSDQSQTKMPIKTKEVVTVINSPAETPPIRTKATKPKTPQKSPQDIARKLFFQTDTSTKHTHDVQRYAAENKRAVTHPDEEEFINCLSKDRYVIPKASITTVNIQQYKKPKPYIKKIQQVGKELSTKQYFTNASKTTSPARSFQAVYMKQQEVTKEPKAAINTVITPVILNKTQNLDFPDVSPLKTPFPTVNVPQETPLPAIDSFKNPYPMDKTNFYNFPQNNTQLNDYIPYTNYESSLFSQQQQPTTSNNPNNANSLVVLENKILSQDEMIDLTELRLSTNTPRFIYPHRPIPEVIIKQEHPDEYHATEASLTSAVFTQTILEQQPQTQKQEKLIIRTLPKNTNKQRKVIINAQKLKLPPDQLADLARKIKEKTTKTKETKQFVNKYQDTNTRMFNAKVQTSNVMTQNFVLPQTQMYGNKIHIDQDHNYYDGHSYFITRPSNSEIINNTSLVETNITTSSEAQPLIFNNYYENSQETENSFESVDYPKSAVEIIDEPVDAEDCFSAVDFIAALGGANAELSPEELNLSASCAFNQNYSPVKNPPSSQKALPSNGQPKASETLRKNTIVIESSKGQETILTNESPDKNDLEKVKEKIKIYHEMNKKKMASYASKQKSINKFQQNKYEDNVQMRCLPPPVDTKLHDDTNVCDMDIEESLHEQRFYFPPARGEQLKPQIIKTDNSIILENLGKASIITKTSENTNAVEKSVITSEPVAKSSVVVDLINDNQTNDGLEAQKAIDLNPNETSKEQLIKPQLENQNQSKEDSIQKAAEQKTEILTSKFSNAENLDKMNTTKLQPEAEQKTDILTSKSSNNEILDKMSTTTLQPETEISKNNETISNATTASKRISKFKKGKINLVTRNKLLTTGRNKADENKTENNGETDENKMECNKKVYLEKRNNSINGKEQEKSAEQIKEAKGPKLDEKTTEYNQEVEKSQGKILDLNAKEISLTEVLDKDLSFKNLSEHSDRQEDDRDAETMKDIPIKDSIPQYLEAENQQNQILSKPDEFNKILSRDSSEDINEEPNAPKPITPTKSCNKMTFITAPIVRETTESLTKQTESSKTEASSLPADIAKALPNSQANKITSGDEFEQGNSEQERQKDTQIKNLEILLPSQALETTQQFTAEIARKAENEVIKTSQQENSKSMLKTTKIEAHPMEESSAEKSEQHSLPKPLIGCLEELPQSKEDNKNTNSRLFENLKVKNDVSDLNSVEKQSGKSLTVAKIEDEQNVFGLPKALMGRMQVLQEPKKPIINKISKIEILESQETKLKSFEARFEKPALEVNMDDTKIFQPKLGIPKASIRFSKTKQQLAENSEETKDLANDETQLKKPKIEITDVQENVEENVEEQSKTREHLNQQSQAILQTMKTARISLIDIVKHTPTKPLNKSPILPFKKSHTDTVNNARNVGGIKSLLNQLPETKKTRKNKEEQNTKKCSRRSSLRTSEGLIPSLPPKITSKRPSLHPLISDDDLEFLPENAEIKFKLTKTKPKEENKITKPVTLIATPAQNTRESLFTSNLTKRTRFYSQTLEANVTITFDNLKAKTNLGRNVKKVATEESCHDSTQDANFVTPIKQRKKLRKTMEDIKKSQSALSDSDSEDFQRDDGLVRACEENNAFLGFEEFPTTTSSFNTNTPPHVISETEHESNTKHGGLKNWLTTGKAISPTFDKITSRKRLRHDNESPSASTPNASTSIPTATVSKQQIPLKKRWDLCSNTAYEETEITDDTSPADDEEEIPVHKIFKRDIKNVIDSNKNAIKSKKIKLEESSFIKPPAKVHNSCKGSKELTENEEDLTKTNSQKGCKEPSKDKKNRDVSEKSVKETEKQTKSKNIEKQFRTENDNKQTKESKHCKEKHSGKTVETSDFLKIKAFAKEIKQNESNKDSKGKTLNVSEPQKGRRGRKSKTQLNTTEAEKEFPKQQETSKKPEISCNLTINRPKRGRSKQNAHQETISSKLDNNNLNESSGEEGPLSSLKKRHSIDFEDLDSNSLLTPLEISTNFNSPTRDPNTEELDSNSLLTPLDKTQEADKSMNEIKPKNNRGKYCRSTNNVSNFNSRLLLITKREQLESEQILTETNSGSGSIQCGLCLTRTQPSQWFTHLAQHYGVGWQMKEERLNIENRTVVFNAITNFMKKHKSIPLACRMCQKVLRSALGILTHIDQCGNQERVECDYCKRDYTKNSLIVHVRSCQARFELDKQKSANEIPNENSKLVEEVVGKSGRLKRHSTIKAENKLKVLGKELENLSDTAKPEIDPKLHIKYMPRLHIDFTKIWSKEIENAGHASCPQARCHFTSSNLPELSDHLKICKHIKFGYICNFCRKAFKTEKEAVDHIIAKHQKGRKRRTSDDSDCGVKTDFEPSSDDAELSEGVDENESSGNSGEEEEDLDDFAGETYNKKGKSGSKNSKCRSFRSYPVEGRKEVFNARCYNLNKEVTKKWNSFIKLNYSCEPLYNEFTPQYSVLNHADYKKYLPSQTVSMKFNFSTAKKLNETVGLPQADIEWTELKRFETINNNMHTYFFLGAPIKFCSWVPLPTDVDEQYLAVIYRQEMFKFIKFNQPKQHHSILLLFKVTQKNKVPQLDVHYGFVVDDGPIHQVTFLPSGGYDASTNRLGLVALATVNSCIRVYSLPLNVDVIAKPENSENSINIDNVTLIDIKPSFLLNLDIAQQSDEDKQQVLMNPQCLQICWSEYSGHQHIIAGFSNGFLGIWNIINNPQQNLNRFVIDNIVNYAPVNYFYLGEKCAKCFALHYDTLGPRWLAVSTAYRKLMVFDIKNFMNPVLLKEEILKNILLSMDWCPIWETFLFSYDDVLPNNGKNVIALNPTNVIFQHNKVDSSTSGTTQVHYTPVTNMCVTALTNGDIAFLDTKELHFDYCLSKKTFEKRAFYALDIKKLNGEALVRLPKGSKQSDNVEITKDWLMHDYNYKEKYGLVFTPLLKLDEKFRKAYLSEKRIPPDNLIPFMRVNSLRCNLNQQAKNLVAAGYENGFLRLLNFNKEKVFKSF